MCKRPNLVKRAGKCNQAVSTHAAIARLQPCDPADRRRLPNGSAGIGSECQWDELSSYSCSRPTGRPAGNASFVPRV